MVKLTPEQQESFVHAEPEVFTPFSGAWGRDGATKVQLRAAKGTLRTALVVAWRNRVPNASCKSSMSSSSRRPPVRAVRPPGHAHQVPRAALCLQDGI